MCLCVEYCGKVLHYGHEVGEFELQSWYYVHFQTNTIGNSINPLIPPPDIR